MNTGVIFCNLFIPYQIVYPIKRVNFRSILAKAVASTKSICKTSLTKSLATFFAAINFLHKRNIICVYFSSSFSSSLSSTVYALCDSSNHGQSTRCPLHLSCRARRKNQVVSSPYYYFLFMLYIKSPSSR